MEKTYLEKSLHNKLYIKRSFFSFKISEEISHTDQLDEFKKILDDLANIEVVVDPEDQGILLLNAQPKSFEQFKDVIIFGHIFVTPDEVQTMVKTKDLQRKQELKDETQGEVNCSWKN